MASPRHRQRAALQRIAERFDGRLLLSRASELAARGHLLEAAALLCPGMHLPMSSDELDLLARIHVRQGLYNQARKRWEDALKIGADQTKIKECIETMDRWLAYKHQMWIWRTRLGLYLAAILLSFWLLYRLGAPFLL